MGALVRAAEQTAVTVAGARRALRAPWAALQSTHPQLTASQRKVLNKLFDAGPDLVTAHELTEITAIAQGLARHRVLELTDLAALGVLLVKSGQGRGTRYVLSGCCGGCFGLIFPEEIGLIPAWNGHKSLSKLRESLAPGCSTVISTP